jgi:hypothetical protein
MFVAGPPVLKTHNIELSPIFNYESENSFIPWKIFITLSTFLKSSV